VDHAEQHAAARQQVLDAYESVCPYVVGNPFIAHWPFAQQFYFLGLHQQFPNEDDSVFQCLYGGGAGGGKSDAGLMALAQYAWQFPQFKGAAFRRTVPQLYASDGLIARAQEWWLPAGAAWNGTHNIFTFPSGATIQFGHMSQPHAHLNHQGAAYHCTFWDELTHWPVATQPRYVGVSRCRRDVGDTIPLRMLASANPGGPGHVWVQKDYVGGVDMVTGKKLAPRFCFVPSLLVDNPHLDQLAYARGLAEQGLHPTLVAQLLRGDWNAREPGDYFQRAWFGPLLDYATDLWPSSDCVRVRWWDLAASKKAGSAFTSGVRMAKHRMGVCAVEHCISFRETPGTRDDLIVQTAQHDGFGVVVGLEIEGGSGGIAQFEHLRTRMRRLGFRVVGARPAADLNTDREKHYLLRGGADHVSESGSAVTGRRGKMQRADPVASALERGYRWRAEHPDVPLHGQREGIRLFAGPWTQGYLDVVEGFPEGATIDEVDATTGAWAWLQTKEAAQVPMIERENRPRLDQHDIHPEEADGVLADMSRDRAGRWRP